MKGNLDIGTNPSPAAINAAIKAAEIFDKGYRVAAVAINGKLLKCTEGDGLVFVSNVANGKFCVSSFTNKPGQNSVSQMARAIDKVSGESLADYENAVRLCLESYPVNFLCSLDECLDYAEHMATHGAGNGLNGVRFVFILAAVAYGFALDEAFDFSKDRTLRASYLLEELESLWQWKTRDHVSGG